VDNITSKSARFALAVIIAGLVLEAGVPKAEATSRSFMCFFDLRSARMNDRCRQVIDYFYKYVRSLQPPLQLEIDGFAQDYTRETNNLRLSMMRARAVARELERLGIPNDILHRQAYGSQDLLVPGTTQDPQNRRVQMFIQPQ
jgi:outer membrane protein OmpA-like peptidoglycan-associated protein